MSNKLKMGIFIKLTDTGFLDCGGNLNAYSPNRGLFQDIFMWAFGMIN
jgi:hypothetical protein